jgi:ribosomal protein S18 acetylase RimI-like enzyme
MLHKDEWLSSIINKNAYRLVEPWDVTLFPDGIISTKISLENTRVVNQLINNGFNIIEILAQFKQISPPTKTYHNSFEIELAQQADKEQVIAIANEVFTFSRFHKDSKISKIIAHKIKAEWVSNYFNGLRGTCMFVSKDEGIINGFILLIDNVIDLIGVKSSHARQGIASKLIAFANEQVGMLVAGTQLENRNSVGLYQKNGFVLENASYVLHKHVG